MARIEPIEYLETCPHRKDPVETYVRVSTILKDWYIPMFEKKYSAKIVASKPCGWWARQWVLLDIPNIYLPEVVKFSSTNKYKKAYRLIWD